MNHYGFLLIAMSVEEAKETLGFSRNENPSPQEIKNAHRKRMLETHPDRGGSDEAATEVNVAKDILDGKIRPSGPSYSRSRPSGPSYSRPESHGPARAAVVVEVSFQEAASKAGVPSSVEWLFVTPAQRGPAWSGDTSERSENAYVAYGRTTSKHVFIAAKHWQKQESFSGGIDSEDIWTINLFEYPITDETKESQNPAWLYGHVVRALKTVSDKKFNSKVLDAKGWKLGQDIEWKSGNKVSIKNWLVGSGQVSGDAPSVAGRKHVVEFTFMKSFDKKPGYVPTEDSSPGGYFGDWYQMTLIIDGTKYDLSESDAKLMLKRTGSKTLLDLMFGRYQYGGEKKNVTRMGHNGLICIKWWLDNLKDLPQSARDLLLASVKQMGG